MLDTGFLYEHEDAANVPIGYDSITDTDTANDGDGRDDNAQDPGDAGRGYPDTWHDSHVAGTIGALAHNGIGAVGINKEVNIIPVRVLGKCGGKMSDALDAVLWSVDLYDDEELGMLNLPRVHRKANIINMSVSASGRCTASMARVFERVADCGTLVIAAAGNSATDATNFVPAFYPSVVTVAASDLSGSLVRGYFNFGQLVWIMAPGGGMNSDIDRNGLPDGILSMSAHDYAFSYGTSMAAVHVSGLAAYIFAFDPNISPTDAANLMINFGKRRTPEQCPENCGPLLNAGFWVPNQH